MKQVDLGEPRSLLDQEYLGCTQRECKPNLKIVQTRKDLLESLISAGTFKQLLGWEMSHVDTIAWSSDMEVHAKKCVERYCELANQENRALIQSLFTVIG